MALQAIKNAYAVVLISGVWAFFSLVSAWIFIPVVGVWGATISIIVGFVAALLCTWVLYWIMVYQKYIA